MTELTKEEREKIYLEEKLIYLKSKHLKIQF